LTTPRIVQGPPPQNRITFCKTAWLIDQADARAARTEIATIKVIVPRITLEVLDRAIQVHGAMGVSDDTPLAAMHAWVRAMRIFDGPDEVHVRTIARQELRRYLS
jgi:acyl-CoA dehydrogenase